MWSVAIVYIYKYLVHLAFLWNTLSYPKGWRGWFDQFRCLLAARSKLAVTARPPITTFHRFLDNCGIVILKSAKFSMSGKLCSASHAVLSALGCATDPKLLVILPHGCFSLLTVVSHNSGKTRISIR